MSLPVLDLLVGYFYSMFGSPLIIMLVLTFVIIMGVLAMRGDLSVMLLLLIPLFSGIVVSTAYTNFIEFPTWILMIIFIIAGVVFTVAIISYAKS